MSTRARASVEEMLRYMSTATSRRAEQAIEELNGASAGANPPGSERRREPREPYRGQVSIRAVVRTTTIVIGGEGREVSVEVFARNLSSCGFGFVAPAIYLPEDGPNCSIAMHGHDVFQVGKTVYVAIVRPEGLTRWMPARVVRARIVNDGFVECGVEFV